jgi:hypothetical protein
VRAVVDTGSYCTVVPQYLWNGCTLQMVREEARIYGFAPDVEECNIPASTGQLTGFIFDDDGRMSQTLRPCLNSSSARRSSSAQAAMRANTNARRARFETGSDGATAASVFRATAQAASNCPRRASQEAWMNRVSPETPGRSAWSVNRMDSWHSRSTVGGEDRALPLTGRTKEGIIFL